MNGHLVTITSPAEDDFVVRLLNDARYWYAAPDTGFMRGPWIGAVQLEGAREPDGGWRWVTGEPLLYSNWRNDEPNDGRSPYGPQQRIFYHTESTEWLKAQWGDAGDATSLERGLRSFVVEFDGFPLPREHCKDDPYASLVLQPSPTNHISLVARGQKTELLLRRRFAEKTRTAFVIPGVYSWEILDGSNDNQRIGKGSIELRGGERVEFTPDGRVLQSGM